MRLLNSFDALGNSLPEYETAILGDGVAAVHDYVLTKLRQLIEVRLFFFCDFFCNFLCFWSWCLCALNIDGVGSCRMHCRVVLCFVLTFLSQN